MEWKGLIADMLYFYSQYIRDPIVAIVRFITFDYIRPNGPAIDALLLYLIYFSAEKRAIGKLSERSALNSSMFIAAVIALPMILLSLLLLVLYLIDRHLIPGVWHYAESIVIFIPLVLILWSLYQWIRYLNWLAKGNRPEGLVPESQSVLYKIAVRQFVQFATPILAAFLALVLLASINSGFS